MSADEDKRKHLDFIQLTITRMGANSFLLKGWTVTIVAAIFALTDKSRDSRFIYVVLLPTIVFWVLDGYYLSIERLFRKLYDAVANDKDNVPRYSMDYSAFSKDDKTWLRATFAKSELLFYVPVMLLSIIWLLMK